MPGNRIPENSYIVILPYMINDLKLKGNELIAYALINGFSNDGESFLKCSLSFFEKWLNCSRPTAVAVLNKLVDKQLILKETTYIENTKKVENRYKINNDRLKNLTNRLKNLTQYNIYNNSNNKNNNIKSNDGLKNLTSASKNLTREEKLQSKFESCVKQYNENEISDNVAYKLLFYFKVLQENGKVITEQKIQANLTKLAKYPESKQLQAIKTAEEMGWLNIYPESKGSFKGSYHNEKVTRKEIKKNNVEYTQF